MSKKSIAGNAFSFPDCTICLEPLQCNLITSLCGHVFHQKCFKDWKLNGNERCPICKKDASLDIKLIYDVKYSNKNNDEQTEPESIDKIFQQKLILEKENIKLENEKKNILEDFKNFQNKVEDFQKRVEENTENTMKYRQNYLEMKIKYDELNDKDEKNEQLIRKLKKENQNLKDNIEFNEEKSKINNQIDLISKKDNIESGKQFDAIFYKLSNSDNGELKELREYYHVLEQNIVKLQKENENLKKEKKMQINNNLNLLLYNKDLNNFSKQKRDYQDLINQNKKNGNEIGKVIFNETKVNEIKMCDNSGNRKLFKNPFTNKSGHSFIKNNK